MADNKTTTTTQNNVSDGSGEELRGITDNTPITVELVERTSKAGNKYVALETRVGEYTTLAFPTKIEQMYIDNILNR